MSVHDFTPAELAARELVIKAARKLVQESTNVSHFNFLAPLIGELKSVIEHMDKVDSMRGADYGGTD